MHKKPKPIVKRWVLYVLRCKDDTLYCGITNNLPARIRAHNRGKGARYTKGRGPVLLIRSWSATGMSAALRAERAFKAMTRMEKEKKIVSRSRRDAVSLLLRVPARSAPGRAVALECEGACSVTSRGKCSCNPDRSNARL